MLVSSRNLMVLKFSEFNIKFEVTFGKKCIAW